MKSEDKKKANIIKPKSVDINSVKPYENNPRLNKDAVEAVKKSIENYGYIQPIVVDKDMVIIVGHTRHSALKELGYTKIDVIISDMSEAQAAKYRLVDNKVHEMADWDMTKLKQELREVGEGMEDFFKDWDFSNLMSEDVGIGKKDVTGGDVKKTEQDLEKSLDVFENKYQEVECPNCHKKLKIVNK